MAEITIHSSNRTETGKISDVHTDHLRSADKDTPLNVGQIERWASLFGGAALAVYGLGRRTPSSLMLAGLGVGLVYRGATGHCKVYHNLKISTSEENGRETYGIHVEQAITIDKTQEELYRIWRDLERLPRFMNHLKSVTVTNEKHSHWEAKGPAGKTIAWDAEIIMDEPGQRIAWRSLYGADVENAGSVRFIPAPGNRGTEVHVTLQYYPAGGVLGMGFAKIFGEEPSQQVAADLKRFKQMLETGEIATTQGQPSGASAQRALLSPGS